MNFVKTAVLESRNGVIAQERHTKAVDAKGLDLFTNRDRFVSQGTAALKKHYAIEGHERQECVERRQWISQTDEAVHEDNVDEFGPTTRTQDEYDFLQGHVRMQQRQQERTEKEIEDFRKIRQSAAQKEEDDLEKLLVAQRKRLSIKKIRDQVENGRVGALIMPRKRKPPESTPDTPIARRHSHSPQQESGGHNTEAQSSEPHRSQQNTASAHCDVRATFTPTEIGNHTREDSTTEQRDNSISSHESNMSDYFHETEENPDICTNSSSTVDECGYRNGTKLNSEHRPVKRLKPQKGSAP